MAFAGLWESWKAEDATIELCTIITTEANELLVQLHNRMPVILHPAHFAGG
jgi:putative SOS response-associated peptidase YedK